MTFKKSNQVEKVDAVADDDIIVADEVYKFTNPYKNSQIAARINFNDRTIAPRSVPMKLHLSGVSPPASHPLKRKLILKQSTKAKKAKEIIESENVNDVIETAYYR